MGRFLQADTVVPEPGNLQALNRFGYVYNNPIRYTNPSGYFSEDELDAYFPDWRDTWSELLKTLMLDKGTTWGSVLYLGYGGDEPALIVLIVLQQNRPGKNDFSGAFHGLDGPDKSRWYWEDATSWGKYSHGTAFTDFGSGYTAASYEQFENATRQRGKSRWLSGKTLGTLSPKEGADLGPGVGLGRYQKWGLDWDWKDWASLDKDWRILLEFIPDLQVSYPAVLVGNPTGAPGYYDPVPRTHNSVFEPQAQ